MGGEERYQLWKAGSSSFQPRSGADDEDYREKYFDFNVQHFHEKLREVHGIQLSYTWVKTGLQTAGLVKRRKKPGSHRKRYHRRVDSA